jgi:hypothetical protein
MSEQRYPVNCGLIVTAESAEEAAAKVAAILSLAPESFGIRLAFVGVRNAIPDEPSSEPVKPDQARNVFDGIMGSSQA